MSQVNAQWRSLEELAQDADVLSRIEQEFPMLGAALAAPRDRRHALALMAASLALAGAGLSGCDGAPEGQLIPAVRMPAGIVPGMPDYYSSAHIEGGYAAGTVVKHFMGRPIKVEGNPFHPASLGATSPIAQAELLNFYDPRRSWGVTQANLPRSRSALEQALGEQRDKLAATGGAGFVILTGASTSPTLAAQLDALRRTYPQIRWLHWEAIGRENVDKGVALAYGARLELKPQLQNADVILAIDSDLLSAAPGHLRIAREFAARRNPTRAKMNRLYAIEATPSLTGAVADERFIAGPRETHRVLLALAGALLGGAPVEGPPWLDRIISDLKANRGRAFIHLGPDHRAGSACARLCDERGARRPRRGLHAGRRRYARFVRRLALPRDARRRHARGSRELAAHHRQQSCLCRSRRPQLRGGSGSRGLQPVPQHNAKRDRPPRRSGPRR